jgi:hypothetical protein
MVKDVLAESAFFILTLGGIYLYTKLFPRTHIPMPELPVLHKWVSDGVIAICSDDDYKEWKSEDNVPAPPFTAFFTDDSRKQEDLGNFVTGSIAECHQLERQCRVENSELFIPHDPYRDRRGTFSPVSIETAYSRILGKVPKEFLSDYAFRVH